MNAVLQLVIETFQRPRDIAAEITARHDDRATLWSGAFLVIILVGIVQFAVRHFTPDPVATPETEELLRVMDAIFATPFLTILIMGSALIMSVFAIYLGGRMIGGTGHFPQTLAIMSWLQFVNAVTGSITVVLLALSPQLHGIASVFHLIISFAIFYVTLHFIDVLHGFNSLWTAFGTMVISFVGLAIGLVLILVMIGGAAVQTGAI